MEFVKLMFGIFICLFVLTLCKNYLADLVAFSLSYSLVSGKENRASLISIRILKAEK